MLKQDMQMQVNHGALGLTAPMLGFFYFNVSGVFCFVLELHDRLVLLAVYIHPNCTKDIRLFELFVL